MLMFDTKSPISNTPLTLMDKFYINIYIYIYIYTNVKLGKKIKR